MSIRTKKEIISDVVRTTKIVLFTIGLVLLTSWIGLGTYAITQVNDLKQEVEYYRQKEEKQNSRKTIEVNGQKYILVEDNA